MSIFRKGVKVGKHDVRVGLTKKRGQGILRKLGVLPDDGGRSKFEKDSMGDIQTIRTIIGMGEGFTRPVNLDVHLLCLKVLNNNQRIEVVLVLREVLLWDGAQMEVQLNMVV